MPNRLAVLKDMFWSGEINDAEFDRLAREAGAEPAQIAAFMAEVREQDGVA